ncbi:MAG TPA: hypothetical protein VHM19_13150, partial [Polyangiales bacterium]|nr:hypothetical protein [Polyangiales bacterium]
MTDLPTPKAGGFGELDLPMPKPPPMADESSFGDIDLPDLPPLPNNPPRGGAGFGDIELPSPRAGADIIPPKAPTVQGGHHAVRHQHDESSFGDLNAADSLPPSLLGNDDEANFGDVNTGDDMPPMPIHMGGASGAVANSIPPALFGEEPAEEHEDLSDDAIGDHDLVDDESSEEDDFGELPEGGEEDEGGGGESEEDMEFGMSEGGSDVALPPEMLRRQRGEDPEADQAARSKRAVQLVAAVAIVLAVIGGVGGALGFTNYGYFGVYYLERFMHGNGDATFVHGAIDRAQRTAATDTFRDAHKSLTELGIARKTAGLNRELLTRSLLHESLFLVRFGSETNSSAHVAHILQRLQERHNAAPGIELALAADAARRQAWNEVDPLLAVARAQTPNDPYVDLVAGEVAIRQGKLAEADKAFGLALKHGGAARAQWGLARVAIAKNDDKSAQAAIEETLKLSPLHVEARIAQARVLWLQGKEESALTRLRQALGLEAVDDQFLWTSKPAQAQGYAMLGYVYEQRARWPLARKAYDDALSADPYLVEGLLGAGRVMLRQRLYSDALVRFDSALNVTQKSTNPVVLSGRKADIEARLGQGRAMIALVRANDAKGVLSVLMNENPNDAEIVLAAGQVEE